MLINTDLTILLKDEVYMNDSAKEDVDALRTLLVGYAYPEHKVFIRKGHGFLIFAESMVDATKQLHNMLAKSKS